MGSYIRSGVGLSVILGLAIAVGCSSSDDSSGGGAGAGGASAGSAGKGGSAGSGAAGKGGSSATAGTGNGAAGTGEAGKGESGGESGGITEGGAGGESGGTGGPSETAGAAGADTGPKACNDLVFSGAPGTVAHASPPAPAATYGSLQAGDYRLTSTMIYDGATGTGSAGGLAHVSVSELTVTIDVVLSEGTTTEFKVVMGQPNTSAPTSAKVACSTNALLGSIVGKEEKANFGYSVSGSTFTLFDAPAATTQTYTLITP